MRKNSKHFREAVGDISLEGGFILVTKQLVIFWGSTSTLSIYQQQKHSSFRHSECHSSRIISLIWQIPNQYHHVNTKTIVKSQFVRTHFWNSKVLNHFWKKVECVVSMIIWSKIRMGQHRDGDHREHAPHFTDQISKPGLHGRIFVHLSTCPPPSTFSNF